MPERILVPLLDLHPQYFSIRDEVRAAIDRVLESQRFILGPEVEALESEIAIYSHCRFAIGVSSGTDALLVSLMAIDLKPGDEVITTPYTFFATAAVIARLGTRPVFVDIDPLTYNINPEAIESVVTQRTRAIIPVHLFGQMADMDPITEIAARHKLYVIEDAAQAIGSEYKGRRSGSLGHLGCFSFFPSKNLGGFGDGGMVTTNDPELANRVRILRNHGYQPKYHSKLLGGNFRLDALQAAILRVKLRYLDIWTKARQHNASIYRHLFTKAALQEIVLPAELPDRRHVYNQFVIRSGSRDDLIAYAREGGIGCEIYYPLPVHLQEALANLGYTAGDFPISECASKQTMALPIYAELTEKMLETVVGTLADFYAAKTTHT